GADGGRVSGRLVAGVAVGQAQHALAAASFGFRGDVVAVGQQVVHGSQPGGADVAQPAQLHRGRLAGEHQQPVPGGVAGQIDEEVDVIGADLLGQALVAPAGHVVPGGGRGPEAGGEVVGVDAVAVADEGGLLRVEVLDGVEQEVADGVVA